MSFLRRQIEQSLADAQEAVLENEVQRARQIAFGIIAIVIAAYVFQYAILPWMVAKGWWSTNLPAGLGDQASWGQFGDYVGGILNPIIAAFAFYWLTQSVKIQSVELTATRLALNESSRAQAEQAKTAKRQLEYAREQAQQAERQAHINGLSVLVASANAKIATTEANIAFMANQFVSGRQVFFDLFGKDVNRATAASIVEGLRIQLREQMAERNNFGDELAQLLGRASAGSPLPSTPITV